jgi:23S rRNA (cytidine1920-2'-O)/16S rRNA (cytidine1409-2'-O)-methyltransferase
MIRMPPFASRAGQKLDHALTAFGLDVTGLICADLGCSTGGFVDCLLQHGAAKIYAVDTGYGVLDWKLRNEERVVVMERTNAMHAALPEPVAFISIDVAWTRQRNILPAAAKMLAPGGTVVSLLKLHYEAEKHLLRKGLLSPEHFASTMESTTRDIESAGFSLLAVTESPIAGSGGNREWLGWLRTK